MGRNYKTKVSGGHRVNKNTPGTEIDMCKGPEVDKSTSRSANWRNSGMAVHRESLCQRKGAWVAAGTMRPRPFLVRT